MKNAIFASLLLIFALSFLSCGDDEPETEPVSEITAIYFEKSYSNSAWGVGFNGYLVDNLGQEHNYNLPDSWKTPDIYSYISKDSIFVNLQKTTLGTEKINKDTLALMVSQIDRLNQDSILETQGQTADYGSKNFYAYQWDDSVRKFKRILLKSYGDYPQENTCKAAQEIIRLWRIGNLPL